MTKLPALAPDDPLRAGRPPQLPQAQPTPTPLAIPDEPNPTPLPRRRRASPPAESGPQLATAKISPGEEWTGATDVTTLRLPVEVLRALHERSRRLGVAKGMSVAAALLALLGRGDDELIELVETTQQRYDSARRQARRSA